jgi:hypothetical protein
MVLRTQGLNAQGTPKGRLLKGWQTQVCMPTCSLPTRSLSASSLKLSTLAMLAMLAATAPVHAQQASEVPAQPAAQAAQANAPQRSGVNRRQPRKPAESAPASTSAQPRRSTTETPTQPTTQATTTATTSSSEQTIVASNAEAHANPTPRFMLRGPALRGVQFGPAFEYASWAKPSSLELRSYSGGSEGLRVLALPAGDATSKVPVGAKLSWQAIGAQDGNPTIVSEQDVTQFEKLLAGAFDRAAMHRMLFADASARWECVLTLATALDDNRAGEDWMPEVCVAFGAGKGEEGTISIVALDGNGREVGTAIALRVQDAQPTTPPMPLSLPDANGAVQGLGEVRIATLDLSALGVSRVSQLLVRPTRAGDRTLQGEPASPAPLRAGFKVMLVETAGMPLPEWAVGD